MISSVTPGSAGVQRNSIAVKELPLHGLNQLLSPALPGMMLESG